MLEIRAVTKINRSLLGTCIHYKKEISSYLPCVHYIYVLVSVKLYDSCVYIMFISQFNLFIHMQLLHHISVIHSFTHWF